jgi:hypothetical protein
MVRHFDQRADSDVTAAWLSSKMLEVPRASAADVRQSVRRSATRARPSNECVERQVIALELPTSIAMAESRIHRFIGAIAGSLPVVTLHYVA